MTFKELNPFKIAKLISHHVENVTCCECCKYYKLPKTALCGHSLCRTCWRSRRTCPVCQVSFMKQELKDNVQIKIITENVCNLVDKFEKIFNVKFEEVLMNAENDKTKNVKDWLARCHDYFSLISSPTQHTLQEVHLNQKVSMAEIQVHTIKQAVQSPPKVILDSLSQDNWNKIDPLPDTEYIHTKTKENIIDPMDTEKIIIDKEKNTTVNPHRRLRNEELRNKTDLLSDKHSSINLNNSTDKKLIISKQNWTNVKKMRKEFSKLNQIKRNKLNVSIENCKKTQSTVNKTPDIEYIIDDITPNKTNSAELENISKFNIINKQKTSDAEIVESQTEAKDSVHSKMAIENEQLKENIVGQTENIFPSNNQKNTYKDFENSGDLNITKIPFFKKGSFQKDTNDKNISINEVKINNFVTTGTDTDDVQITIKIGKTLTNIHIKKKDNDVKLKLNTDREIQTSLGPYVLQNNSGIDKQNLKNNVECTVNNVTNKSANKCIQTSDGNGLNMENDLRGCVKPIAMLSKSTSTKKNTDSAETATVNFEITDSVQEELSHTMVCVETKSSQNHNINTNPEVTKSKCLLAESVRQQNTAKNTNAFEDVQYINDDIFESESVNEHNVQLLKNTTNTHSEILLSKHTVNTNKTKSQRNPNKRNREASEDENQTPSKKIKIISLQCTDKNQNQEPHDASKVESSVEHDSDYDGALEQVFASIDADIQEIQKVRNTQNNLEYDKTGGNVHGKGMVSKQFTQKAKINKDLIQKIPDNDFEMNDDQKCSENDLSSLHKGNELAENKQYIPGPETQKCIDNLMTSEICQDLGTTQEECIIVDDVEEVHKELFTPLEDDDDKSVVEETPQKNVSFSKSKLKNDAAQNVYNQNDQIASDSRQKTETKHDGGNDRKCSVVESTLETPLTINKFVDHITHKSTPFARKSLMFTKGSEAIYNDPNRTLCRTSSIDQTTQEKEFMTKAFEESPFLPTYNEKYCISGSCLQDAQLECIKYLCLKYKWSFVSKYEDSLTHLVVGVDGENKSQRSVKYMCALAAGKWIVSFAWIQKCLQSNEIVKEEPFEVLDTTGHCGPMLSRSTKVKLFSGIVFYCMPPFSVFDVATLQNMLRDAGGCVVDDMEGVRVNPNGPPAFLLAEPEDTQEDRFLYLVCHHRVVPLNYEWVLNCLGSYSLTPVEDLLLCPASMVPSETNRWPKYLSPL